MRIVLMASRTALAVVAAAGLVLAGMASEADAQSKGKSIQSEARWVKFDPAGSTVTVKVQKTGKRPKLKEASLKKGAEATFDVKAEGSVLTKTTVAVNGRRGELADIPEGKTVNIYWVEDAAKPNKRFARKIDVIFSEAELEARFPDAD